MFTAVLKDNIALTNRYLIYITNCFTVVLKQTH